MNNSTSAPQNHTSNPVELRSLAEIYTQTIVLVVICIGSVLGNALVITVVFFNHKLHKPTYYFISSLAVADFLVGAIYIPFYIASVLAQEWKLSSSWCNWHTAFISLSLNASLMTLCLVSLDRFLAITDPLRYQTVLTTFRSALLLAAGWIHSVFWAVAPMVGWGEVIYEPSTSTCRPNWGAQGLGNKVYALCLALFAFAVPVFIMVYCYCRIFIVARYHIKHIQKNSVSQSNSASGQRASETKAMKTLLLVLGVFVLAWLPYTVCSVAKMVSGSFEISSTGLNAVITITMMNGCMNPVIYGIRDQRFRKGMKKLLCPCAPQDTSEFNSYLSTKVNKDSSKDNVETTQVEMGNINVATESQT